MSEYIMNHTGEQLDEAIDKVLNGYIDLSKLTLHCSEGKYWTNSYSPSSDILLSNVSFDCGFKPKIFVVTNLSGIVSNSTSTSKVHLLTSLFITDDDYNILLRFSSYLYYHTTNKLYMGSRSTSSDNTFVPTDTGVQGGNGTTVYFRGGNTYQVYAWG